MMMNKKALVGSSVRKVKISQCQTLSACRHGVHTLYLSLRPINITPKSAAICLATIQHKLTFGVFDIWDELFGTKTASGMHVQGVSKKR